MNSTKRLVTTKEVAAYLRITPRSVWNLKRDGVIPAIRVGRVVRYDLDAVLHRLEEMSLADA